MLKKKIYKLSSMFPDSISPYLKSSRFINSFLEYSWFKNVAIWLARSIFNPNQLKMFEAFFTLPRSISVYKKSCWSIQLLLRYRWFQNPWIWLIEHISDHVQVKIYKLFYCFLNLQLPAKNQVDSLILTWNIADSIILQSDLPRSILIPCN